MSKHLNSALKKLNEDFKQLVNICEENFGRCLYSLEHYELDQAKRIITDDEVVDQMEIEIEEECLMLLALYQPVAVDLREIVSILKINNDLERISDLTSNICSRIIKISQFESRVLNNYLLEMGSKVKKIFRDSLESFENKDLEMALSVLKQDEEIDKFHSEMYQLAQDIMYKNPDDIPYAINCISMARFFERIADHSTNISEDVYYMMEAEIIRHQKIE